MNQSYLEKDVEQLRRAQAATDERAALIIASSVADASLGTRRFHNDVARRDFINQILPAVRSAEGRGVFEGQSLIDYVKNQMAGELSYVLAKQETAPGSPRGSSKVWRLTDIRAGMPATEMGELLAYMGTLLARPPR